MREMYFKPLDEHDRQVNQYVDHINHAPYFGILWAIMGLFTVFTLSIVLGIFF